MGRRGTSVLEHVCHGLTTNFEFQFASSTTAHLFVISLGGNFSVGGLLACLHPKNLLPVCGCKHKISSVLIRYSIPL